jgi:hypothetical protein
MMTYFIYSPALNPRTQSQAITVVDSSSDKGATRNSGAADVLVTGDGAEEGRQMPEQFR